MRAAIAVSILATAFGFTACGSDSGATKAGRGDAQEQDQIEAQIEATAVRFAAAVESKDVKVFCRLLSPEAKKRLRYEERRCLVVWGPRRNPLFQAENPDLSIEEVTKIEPPNATARLANGGRLAFLRERGTWYVNLAAAKE
jgi:hypothetical protein